MRHQPAIVCLIALALGTACGAPPSVDMCKKEARCTGDRSDVRQCVDDAKQAREDSKEAGCKSEFDAMGACVKRNTSCSNGALAMDSMDACDEAVAEWFECFGMGPF